jgi:2-keto-4-pentenoate hydratase/2-oxohepta-3-ene-1,7-dioic acid hydratase in catechol pathway
VKSQAENPPSGHYIRNAIEISNAVEMLPGGFRHIMISSEKGARMKATRRQLIASAVTAAAAVQSTAQQRSGVTRYVRFQKGSTTGYGILDNTSVKPIRGDLFGSHKETGESLKVSDVKLLHPVTPPKVLAVGLNYKSHLGSRKPPARPEIFYKPISCLQNPDEAIAIPADSKNTHYEGELVVVIGKRASMVSPAEAKNCIFGVTCGNDVSERDWQNGSDKDLQWWRAKGADTFGPLGPCVATGLDYGKLQLKTILNGKVVQEQSTSDLLFDCPAIVSFVSHYVTLLPGDVIYTGTPGTTQKMNPGDTVDVEIEGIGRLRSPVVATKSKT